MIIIIPNIKMGEKQRGDVTPPRPRAGQQQSGQGSRSCTSCQAVAEGRLGGQLCLPLKASLILTLVFQPQEEKKRLGTTKTG